MLAPHFVEHLIQTYGLWVVFSIVLLESAGLPLPGETALVSAALYAGSTGRLDIVFIVAVAAMAAIIGDNIGYLIGRVFGQPILERHGKRIGLGPERLAVGQYLFRKHGGLIVFFGRFVAFLRAFAALLAGVNRMEWRHFALMNALGGIVWASVFGFGAYMLGERIHAVAGPMSIVFLVVAILLLAAGFVYFRKHERRIEAKARQALATESNNQKEDR